MDTNGAVPDDPLDENRKCLESFASAYGLSSFVPEQLDIMLLLFERL